MIRLRSVEEIIGDRPRGAIPSGTIAELVEVMGEDAASTLFRLHGTRSSEDVHWCLTQGFADTCHADELGPGIPGRSTTVTSPSFFSTTTAGEMSRTS